VQWDAFHLNKNIKWVTKNIDRNNKSGNVENETLGKPSLLTNGRMKGYMKYTALMQVMQHSNI
jgi:hypothetical protein